MRGEVRRTPGDSEGVLFALGFISFILLGRNVTAQEPFPRWPPGLACVQLLAAGSVYIGPFFVCIKSHQARDRQQQQQQHILAIKYTTSKIYSISIYLSQEHELYGRVLVESFAESLEGGPRWLEKLGAPYGRVGGPVTD